MRRWRGGDQMHGTHVPAEKSSANLAELIARIGQPTPHAAQVYLPARVERDSLITDALGKATAPCGVPATTPVSRR